MRGRIGVIPNTDRNIFALQVSSRWRTYGINTMYRPVIVIERFNVEGLFADIGYKWEPCYFLYHPPCKGYEGL